MRTQQKLNVAGLLSVGVLLLAAAASASPGPQYRSLRGLSMGNAMVALVDDKDALYYNPAGLNLINSLGNASARPSLAAYPRNRFQARVNLVGATVPLGELPGFLEFFSDHKKSFSDDSVMREDATLRDDIAKYHRQPIEVGLLHGSEFAMHNFGVAYWMDARVAPYIAMGPLLPQAGIETIQLDAVIQVAGARGFLNNRLAAGAGYRLANRREVRQFNLAVTDLENKDDKKDYMNSPAGKAVKDSLKEKMDGLTDIMAYGHGLDLGVLWQQTSWLRFGGAVQNLGMYLNRELVTPEFTVGLVLTPPLLSSGGVLPRKVNLTMDYEDIFNDERNYKPYSKINLGAEVEQHLWRFFSVRLAGGAKGGYWSAGTGLSFFQVVHIEAASWAEEAGVYTGHIENRYYAVRLGVGL
jgi:hypothetical protein